MAGLFGCRIELTDGPIQMYRFRDISVNNDLIPDHVLSDIITNHSDFYIIKAFYTQRGVTIEKQSHRRFYNYFTAHDAVNDAQSRRIFKFIQSFISLDIYPSAYYSIDVRNNRHGNRCSAGGNELPNINGSQHTIIMRNLGNRMLSSFYETGYLSIRSYYYLFQKMKFLNYFEIHNDLHANNIMVDTDKQNINIIDIGNAKIPWVIPEKRQRTDSPHWAHSFENGLYGIMHEPDRFIQPAEYNDLSTYVARCMAANRFGSFIPWYVDATWYIQGQLILQELTQHHGAYPNQIFNVLMNLKRDIYYTSISMFILATRNHTNPVLKYFALLACHPNPILRPNASTFIKILDKIIAHERYETIIFNELDELCSLPSVIDESIILNTEICAFSQAGTHNKNYIDYLTGAAYRNIESLNYYTTMHLLDSLLQITEVGWTAVSWSDAVATIPAGRGRNRLLTLHTSANFSDTQDEWVRIQRSVLGRLVNIIATGENQHFILRRGISTTTPIPDELCNERFHPIAAGAVIDPLAAAGAVPAIGPLGAAAAGVAARAPRGLAAAFLAQRADVQRAAAAEQRAEDVRRQAEIFGRQLELAEQRRKEAAAAAEEGRRAAAEAARRPINNRPAATDIELGVSEHYRELLAFYRNNRHSCRLYIDEQTLIQNLRLEGARYWWNLQRHVDANCNRIIRRHLIYLDMSLTLENFQAIIPVPAAGIQRDLFIYPVVPEYKIPRRPETQEELDIYLHHETLLQYIRYPESIQLEHSKLDPIKELEIIRRLRTEGVNVWIDLLQHDTHDKVKYHVGNLDMTLTPAQFQRLIPEPVRGKQPPLMIPLSEYDRARVRPAPVVASPEPTRRAQTEEEILVSQHHSTLLSYLRAEDRMFKFNFKDGNYGPKREQTPIQLLRLLGVQYWKLFEGFEGVLRPGSAPAGLNMELTPEQFQRVIPVPTTGHQNELFIYPRAGIFYQIPSAPPATPVVIPPAPPLPDHLFTDGPRVNIMDKNWLMNIFIPLVTNPPPADSAQYLRLIDEYNGLREVDRLLVLRYLLIINSTLDSLLRESREAIGTVQAEITRLTGLAEIRHDPADIWNPGPPPPLIWNQLIRENRAVINQSNTQTEINTYNKKNLSMFVFVLLCRSNNDDFLRFADVVAGTGMRGPGGEIQRARIPGDIIHELQNAPSGERINVIYTDLSRTIWSYINAKTLELIPILVSTRPDDMSIEVKKRADRAVEGRFLLEWDEADVLSTANPELANIPNFTITNKRDVLLRRAQYLRVPVDVDIRNRVRSTVGGLVARTPLRGLFGL